MEEIRTKVFSLPGVSMTPQNNKIKKIIAVTGIRSEVDILLPIVATLKKNNFDVSVILSGAHLAEFHGNTITGLQKAGIKIIDRVDSLFMTGRKTLRIKGLGNLILGISQTIEREKPDLLLVVGDREEAIATALVGNYMDVIVAHIGGGDTVYGNADDPIRHSVSRLAHIHLAINRMHTKVLEATGEEKFRIHFIGNPVLDLDKDVKHIDLKKLSQVLDFDIVSNPYVILIQHPLSSERSSSYKQASTVLNTLELMGDKHGLKTIGIYPNTDPGAFDIIQAISEHINSINIKFYKNLDRATFINVIRNAKALVGNSSMGIVEAPYYGLPVVNIGNRQLGRINSGNVVFVKHNPKFIQSEIERACFDEDYRKQVEKNRSDFGDGKAASRAVQVLSNINPNDPKWLIKKLNLFNLLP